MKVSSQAAFLLLVACLAVAGVEGDCLSPNTTAALCSAAADLTYPIHQALLNSSNPSAFSPTCLTYLAALQCLHNCSNTTLLATLIEECLSIVNTTCPRNASLLLCHSTSSCDPLANCSTTPPVTMVTDPPTTTILPTQFGPFSLLELIGVAVGGAGGLLLLLCLICLCLCCCVCCCCCGREGEEEGGGVKVGETVDGSEGGMTMLNPMALEHVEQGFGGDLKEEPTVLGDFEEDMDNSFMLSNLQVDDTGLVSSYHLTDSDVSQLYELLGEFVLPPDLVTPTEVLKDGVFALTRRGYTKKTFKDGTTFQRDLVVKTVKGYSTKEDLTKLLQVLAVMREFDHPNVLPMMGVVVRTPDHLPLVVRAHLPLDVKAYLRNMRKSVARGDAMPQGLSESELVRICLEVAQGMEYLATKGCVHGNLKARNCLLDSSHSVKLTDFCPLRDASDSSFVVSSAARWLAPEVLQTTKLTMQSDVWSFGVVCWEVFNLGRVPYHGVDTLELPQLLKKGGRLQQPMLSPQPMYEVMQKCWEYSPAKRLDVQTLHRTVKEVFQQYHPPNA